MAGRKRGDADTKASPAKKAKATKKVEEVEPKKVEQEEVAKTEDVKTDSNVAEKEAEKKNPDSTVDKEKGTKDKLEPQPVPKATTKTRDKVISITITNLTRNMIRLGSLTIPPKNEESGETGFLVVTEVNKIYSIMRSPVKDNLQRVGQIKVETEN